MGEVSQDGSKFDLHQPLILCLQNIQSLTKQRTGLHQPAESVAIYNLSVAPQAHHSKEQCVGYRSLVEHVLHTSNNLSL